jgi:hypothetical protein
MSARARVLSRGALAGLVLVAGTGFLIEPISDPISTKWALHLTEDSVPRGPATGAAEGSGHVANANVPFLRPRSRWDQVTHGLGEWFPTSRGVEFQDVETFSTTDELLVAVQDGQGVCSTYAEAFMVLCSSAGRACREWALIPEPGSSWWGHSLVDVWVPELARWGMVDVFYGFWPQGEDGLPLSALQFERAVRDESTDFTLVPLRGGTLRTDMILAHYGNPRSRLAAMLDNDPARLARHWTRTVESFSKPVGQLLQWAMGVGPSYYLPDSPEYAAVRVPLIHLRTRTITGLLLALLGVCLVAVPRSRRASQQGRSH